MFLIHTSYPHGKPQNEALPSNLTVSTFLEISAAASIDNLPRPIKSISFLAVAQSGIPSKRCRFLRDMFHAGLFDFAVHTAVLVAWCKVEARTPDERTHGGRAGVQRPTLFAVCSCKKLPAKNKPYGIFLQPPLKLTTLHGQWLQEQRSLLAMEPLLKTPQRKCSALAQPKVKIGESLFLSW